jgi:hypothetical protein
MKSITKIFFPRYLQRMISKSQSKIHLAFIILVSITSTSAMGQKFTSEIEIIPFVRIDWHPKFSYAINSANTNIAKIRGTSWGGNTNYKLPVRKNLYLKVGVGYYRYSFNKIDSYNPQFGRATARIINFPSPLYIVFATDKYWYNCVSMNIGIEKLFNIKKKTVIVTGINLNNFYTYSQYYHITANYPTGPPNHRYTLKNNHYFGFSANLQATLLRRIGKIAIGPSVILPVFDLWKQDGTFPQETNSGSRSKWLNGIGLGISSNYSLSKNKK